MADQEYVVMLALEARDKATRIVDNVTHALSKLGTTGGETKAILGDVGSATKAIGIAGAATAGAVFSFFGVAEHAAMGLQEALTEVQVNAHLTTTGTDEMGRAIERVAIGTENSGSDMVRALGPVAGELQRLEGGTLKAEAATRLLSAASHLATATNGDLAGSTKTLTDLLLVYHLKTEAAAGIADTLFQAHAQLGIGTDRLAMMLQRLQPRIAGSGIDMQHLLGIVRELTPTVGSGTRAMMLVGGVLQNLQNPSKAATDALAKLGVHLRDSKGQFVGFQTGVQAIHDALAKVSDPAQRAAIMAALFGHNANVAAVLVAGGAKGIEDNTNALTAQGTAAAAAALKNQDAAKQLEILPKTIQTLSESIGMVLLPGLNRLLTAIMPVVNAIADWTIQNPDLATTILAVVGVAGALLAGLVFLGPVIGEIGAVIGLVLSPVGLLAAGFLAVIVLMARMPGVLKPVTDLFESFHKMLGAVIDSVGGLLGPLLAFVTGGISASEAAKRIAEAFHLGSDAAHDLWTAIGRAFAIIVQTVGNGVTDVAKHFVDLGAAFVGWVAPKVPELLAGLGKALSTLIGWIGTSVPKLGDALGGWASQFADWLAPKVPAMMDSLRQTLKDILGWVIQNVPVIATTMFNWTSVFTGWAAQIAPVVIPQLLQTVTDILNWIAQQPDKFVANLGAWVESFVSWVEKIGPPLVAAFSAVAAIVQTWMLQQVGKFGDLLAGAVAGLGSWGDEFVAWLSDVVPKVAAALGTIAATIIGWVAPVLLQLGLALAAGAVTVGSAVVGWFADILPHVITGLATLATNIIGALGRAAGQIAAALPGMAGTIIAGISSWFSGVGPRVVSGLGDLAVAIVTTIGTLVAQVVAALPGMGDSIITGMSAWFDNIGPTVTSGLASLGTSLVTSLSSAFDQGAAWLADLSKPKFDTATASLASWKLPLGGLGTSTIDQLSTAFDKVATWVTDRGTKLLDAMASWAGAFGDWAVSAAPKMLSGLDNLLSAMLGWIRSTNIIFKLASALSDWTVAFVRWAVPAAIGVGVAFIAFLTHELVAHGPEIAVTMAVLAGQLVGGIAAGILAHPEVVAEAIGFLMLTRTIGAVVRGSAGAVGDMFTRALFDVLARTAGMDTAYDMLLNKRGLIGKLQYSINSLWRSLTSEVVELVGRAHAAAYAAAVRVADAVTDAVRGLWERVTNSSTVRDGITRAAAFGRGVYAAALRAVNFVVDGLEGLWQSATTSSTVRDGITRAAAFARGAYQATMKALNFVVDGLQALWQSAVASPAIRSLVVRAAAVAQGAYDLAMRAVDFIVNALSALWQAVIKSPAIKALAAAAGAAAGAVYAAASALASKVIEMLTALWVAMGMNPMVLGAATASGAEAGAAYDTGMIGAIEGGDVAVGIEAAVAPAAVSMATAGEVAGTGFAARFIGAVTAGVAGLGGILALAVPAVIALPAVTTPPVTDSKGKYMYPGEDPMFGPHGPLNFLSSGYDSLFGTNYGGKNGPPTPPATPPPGPYTAPAPSAQDIANAPRGKQVTPVLPGAIGSLATAPGYPPFTSGKQVTPVLPGPIGNLSVDQKAVQAAADTGRLAAGAYADSLLQARASVGDAWSKLVDMMKHPLDVGATVAKDLGELTSKNLREALASSDPAIKAQAEYTKQLLLDELKSMAQNTGPLTKDAMTAVEQALKSADPDIRASAQAIEQGIVSHLQAFEKQSGPLSRSAMAEVKAALQSSDPAIRAAAEHVVRFGILRHLEDLQRQTGPLSKRAMEEVRKGLQSKDPDIRAAAQAIKNHITTEFTYAASNAFGWGQNVTAQFGQGLQSPAVLDFIRRASMNVTETAAQFMHGASPPPKGPLHTIDIGGYNIGKAWSEGVSKGAAEFRLTVPSLGVLVQPVRAAKSGAEALPSYATGAWDLLTDQMAMLHAGEMVVPARAAESVRQSTGAGAGLGDALAALADMARRPTVAEVLGGTNGAPGTPGAPGASGGAAGAPGTPETNIDVHVYLDNRVIRGAVSKMMFDEERRFAGPAGPGSPF